jgi:hypothetical protein
MPDRRRFLALAGGAALVLAVPRRLRALGTGPEHPTPRAGIDASRVLTAEQLREHPDVIDAYDGVRKIPEIIDGIRCHCGCATLPGYYSLLTCYESGGMAMMCEICQGQGRLAWRLHQSGRSLEQIRRAIDARFG